MLSSQQIVLHTQQRHEQHTQCPSLILRPTGREMLLSLHLTVLSTQQHRQYTQCPSWFFIPLDRCKFCGHRQHMNHTKHEMSCEEKSDLSTSFFSFLFNRCTPYAHPGAPRLTYFVPLSKEYLDMLHGHIKPVVRAIEVSHTQLSKLNLASISSISHVMFYLVKYIYTIYYILYTIYYILYTIYYII